MAGGARTHGTLALAGLLLALLPPPAAGLPADVPLRALDRDTFRDRDGLPQNAVRALLHASSGELWVATDEGLGRYDGATWTHVDRRGEPGLVSNMVTALAETPDGTLWIGTYDGGLVRHRGGRYEPVDVEGAPAGLRITALAADPAGGLWVASYAGVYHLAGGRAERFTMASGLADDRVSALAVDREGAAWVGTRRGLARIAGGEIQPGPAELAGGPVNALVADPSGGVWVGAGERGLARVDAGEVRFVAAALGLPAASVSALAWGRDGALWIGLQSGGVARLRGGRAERFVARDGLASDWLSAIAEDGEGAVWLGTQDAGLMRLRQGDFSTIGAADGLSSDTIEALLQTRQGDVWLATDGGVDVLPRGALPPRRVAVPAPMSLLEDRAGAIWIGTYGRGLWRWRAGALHRLQDDLPPNTWIRAVAEDREGVIWAGTTEGLYRVHGDRLAPVSDGLPPERPAVVALGVTASGLFVGTEGAGLFRRGGGRFTREEAGPPPAWVVSGFLADEDGTLWMATEGGGLWRRRGGIYAHMGVAQGLVADTIWTILDDRQGSLWVSSNRGAARLPRAELEAVLDGRAPRVDARTWSMDEGLHSQEMSGLSHPGGWRAADGKLWFATVRGVSVVDPARLQHAPPPPTTAIRTVRVDGRPVPPGDRLDLPAGATRLVVAFGARTLLSQRRVSSRYRLAGYDDAWSTARGPAVAEYTRLPPGTYRLEVQSRLGEGPWGPVASLSLRQAAPWWRAPAALSAAAALLAALGAWALLGPRRAARRARAEAALRAEVAALSALLPRCGWCHGPRGDPDYLAAVEAAMRARPASQFDRGLCPACAARHAGPPPRQG